MDIPTCNEETIDLLFTNVPLMELRGCMIGKVDVNVYVKYGIKGRINKIGIT